MVSYSYDGAEPFASNSRAGWLGLRNCWLITGFCFLYSGKGSRSLLMGEEIELERCYQWIKDTLLN